MYWAVSVVWMLCVEIVFESLVSNLALRLGLKVVLALVGYVSIGLWLVMRRHAHQHLVTDGESTAVKPYDVSEAINSLTGIALPAVEIKRDGKVVACNPAFLALAACDETSALARNWWSGHAADVLPSARAVFDSLWIDPARCKTFELALLVGSEPVPVLWHVLRPVSSTEPASSVVLVGLDLSSQRNVETNLHLSQQRFNALGAYLQEALWIMDTQGHFTYVSEGLRRFSDYTPDELIGRSPVDFVAPNCVQRTTELLARALGRADELPESYANSFLLDHVRKDGKTRVVEVNNTILRTPGGSFVGFVGSIRDVTENQHSQQQLHLLETGLNAAPNGVVITDNKGRIQWVNDSFTKLTGYTREEAIGQTPRLLKSGKHSDSFYSHLWGTILAGDSWTGELTNRKKDGTPYIEEMTVAPVRNIAGEVAHFIAIKTDITERRGLENRFLRAQRLQSVGLLAGGIAHDLNNVLTPIMLSAEMLREETLSPAGRNCVERIRSSVVRSAGVIQQVLTFSRGSDGQRAPIKLKALVQDVVGMARETFPRSIETSVQFPMDTWNVVGDFGQLHQVLMNLAVNARDAMPQGGALTVRTRNFVKEPDDQGSHLSLPLAAGKYVVISVKDTGTGIAPDVLDRIFEPFFTTKERGSGTGLGLAVAHGIVRAHGGIIDVDSVVGEGSEFMVYLAATTDNAEPVAAPKVLRIPAGNNRRVLLVDDESFLKDTVAQLLRKNNFRVVTAADGKAAWSRFSAEPDGFDLIITDLMMPRMSGQEFLERVRGIAPKIPVIVLTGLMPIANDEITLKSLDNLAVAAHLKKPFNNGELLDQIASVLSAPPEEELTLGHRGVGSSPIIFPGS